MTVTYTSEVSKTRLFGFAKLLFRWKGSIYKLIYREFVIYALLYYFVAVIYRSVLSKQYKRMFEQLSVYSRSLTSLVPITFVLGFYVALVMARWWQQYNAIPWPDRVCLSIGAYIHGHDERGCTIRRTLARYVNLMSTLTLRSVSSVICTRFPTMDHLLEAGLCTVDERLALDETLCPHGIWLPWIPSSWFSHLLITARKEGRIEDDYQLKSIMDEMLSFRGSCGLMWNYDWISVPLVYTQVVTIAVYTFFVACLFGRQYLYELPSSHAQPDQDIDFFVPLLTAFQFFFYMGWLKVAEELICPYGEDDDDFDLNWIVDRNLQVSYTIVDGLNCKYPKLNQDIHWDDQTAQMPYTNGSVQFKTEPYLGSTLHMDLEPASMSWVPDDNMTTMKQKLDDISQNSDDENFSPARKESLFVPHAMGRLRRMLSGESRMPTNDEMQSTYDSQMSLHANRQSASAIDNMATSQTPLLMNDLCSNVFASHRKRSMLLATYRARRTDSSMSGSCWQDIAEDDAQLNEQQMDAVLSMLAQSPDDSSLTATKTTVSPYEQGGVVNDAVRPDELAKSPPDMNSPLLLNGHNDFDVKNRNGLSTMSQPECSMDVDKKELTERQLSTVSEEQSLNG